MKQVMRQAQPVEQDGQATRVRNAGRGRVLPVQVASSTSSERISVVRADASLGERLERARLVQAERLSVADVLWRYEGAWEARRDARFGRDGLGLLVIEGLLIRRLGLQERYGAELLSVGDLLQPAAHDGEHATLPFSATWRVLIPLKLAVLDLEWMNRMAPFPEVMAEIVTRVMVRSRRLASLLTITHHHRLEDRLRLLLWELADRYGRVTKDSVRLDLRLTHELLSELAGAHRPSVSVAVTRLERSGHLQRRNREWHLIGDRPSAEELQADG